MTAVVPRNGSITLRKQYDGDFKRHTSAKGAEIFTVWSLATEPVWRVVPTAWLLSYDLRNDHRSPSAVGRCVCLSTCTTEGCNHRRGNRTRQRAVQLFIRDG